MAYGIITGLIGIGLSGWGSYSGAKAAKKAEEDSAEANRLVSDLIMDRAYMNIGVAQDQSRLMRSEADIMYADGLLNAYRTAITASKLFATQKASYIKSGVELTGSPMAILAETVKFANEDVTAIVEKTDAVKDLMYRKAALAEIYALAELEIAGNEAWAVNQGATLQASAASATYSAQMYSTVGNIVTGIGNLLNS